MDDVSEILRTMTPHRLTEWGMARMAVRREYVNGVLIGRSVHPMIVAVLEEQGYDPRPFVQHLLDVEAEQEASDE